MAASGTGQFRGIEVDDVHFFFLMLGYGAGQKAHQDTKDDGVDDQRSAIAFFQEIWLSMGLTPSA